MTNKALVQIGWDDAPWLGEEIKAGWLASIPSHMREARTKGYPTQGSGNIYQVPLDSVKHVPFPIPPHYKRIYGMDVGWNRTAVVWGALDPDTDILYLYSCYYPSEAKPSEVAQSIRGRDSVAEFEIPGFIDPASRGRSQLDGNTLLGTYTQDLGLSLRPADNAREAGIYAVSERLATGRLRVFETLLDWFTEYLLYHRDIDGKIVKEKDHLMDATRYLVMSLKYAEAKPVNGPRGNGGYGGDDYFR